MAKNYRKRSIQKLLRFDEKEWDYLQSKVEASPFNNFQNFARVLLITGEINITDYKDLEKLNFEVNRIGNNINQVTKLAHEFSEVSEMDIRDLQNQMIYLIQIVSEQLNQEKQKRRQP